MTTNGETTNGTTDAISTLLSAVNGVSIADVESRISQKEAELVALRRVRSILKANPGAPRVKTGKTRKPKTAAPVDTGVGESDQKEATSP